MKHKGIMLSTVCVTILVAVIGLLLSGGLHWPAVLGAEPEPKFRTSQQEIQILQDGVWQPFQLTGVNIGTGYPGLFPNETGISEETYYRWFNLIAEMNANTVRVYKIQPPAFYTAFARYNQEHDRSLYLLQGIDFPEPLIYSAENILDEQQHAALFRDTRNAVRAIHGDWTHYDSNSDQLDIYSSDVSDYVLGYLLGIEWDELFVEYTCRINEGLQGFSGTYLTCGSDANPFEIFLAQWGDHLLNYEMIRYGTQPLISFCNWPDTDPFLNELSLSEELGAWQKRRETPVDLEHIHVTDQIRSGLFASYNVYPYFPSFLQYGPYINYMDETGIRNPYRKYLMTLVEHHKYPVVISEYGIPAARSRAYGEVWRNFSHGGLTETEQGNAVAALYHDIQAAGCAGSIVFTWQDEWYKTIWNEKLISDPNRRAYWSNAQCAEQFFGLLAFEPGAAGTTCYPDGDRGDWSGVEPIIDNGTSRLYMQQDEKYLYFMVEGLDHRPGHRSINLALNITPKSGSNQIGSVQFQQPVDFLIQIDSQGKSGLYVDAAYDLLPYSALGGYRGTTHATMQTLLQNYEGSRIVLSEDPAFVLVERADGNIYSRLASQWIVNPVGKLKPGNANPDNPAYDSNADYCLTEDFLELRIPWQLLNFTDPSSGSIVDDLSKHDFQIEDLSIKSVDAAIYYDDASESVEFGTFSLESWDSPTFHERLKDSYYILQDLFKGDS